MANKNERMILKGFDCESKLCSIVQEQPFSDQSLKHYGMPITAVAALNMIKRFKDQNVPPKPDNPFNDVFWVEFSRASIFRILAQKNCEYIRFYFAIPNVDENKASLTLEGLDASGTTIGSDIMVEVANAMEAVAAGGRVSASNEPTIYQMLSDPPPPHEEKGNDGHPLQGTPNVKSMQDFLDELKNDEHFADITFSEFVEKFYAHADAQF